MKQLLIKCTAIFAFIVLVFTSCEGPEGPPGWANIDIRYYPVLRWSLSSDKNYFFAEVVNPAITTNVFYNGVINGYLVKDYETVYETHIPLPFDIYYNNVDQAGNPISWTETVSFDVMPGKITFYYEPSDFSTVNTPPSLMFKIVSMW